MRRPHFGGKVCTHQPGTSAKDTWAIELSYVYEYQLATQIEQIDRGIIHLNTLVVIMSLDPPRPWGRAPTL